MGSTTLTRTDAFRQFVQSDSFPCIGAKSAMVRDQLVIAEFGDIDSAAGDINLRRALEEFIEELDFSSPVVQSFVAIFTGPTELSETEFERALWNRLQSLHNLDVVEGRGWAESAERDPESAHFSMGLLGEAFLASAITAAPPAATRLRSAATNPRGALCPAAAPSRSPSDRRLRRSATSSYLRSMMRRKMVGWLMRRPRPSA